MCPITIPDPVAEAKEAIDALTELYGTDFSAHDVADWMAAAADRRWADHWKARASFEFLG